MQQHSFTKQEYICVDINLPRFVYISDIFELNCIESSEAICARQIHRGEDMLSSLKFENDEHFPNDERINGGLWCKEEKDSVALWSDKYDSEVGLEIFLTANNRVGS